MAETFRQRIEALTGFTTINSTDKDDSISEWLTDGAKELLGILPVEKLHECIKSTQFATSAGYSLNSSTTGNVIGVTRKNVEGYKKDCRRISSTFSSRAEDPNDLMFASSTDPIYYINNNTVYVLPAPSVSQKAEVTHIPLPAISHGDTSIGNDYAMITGVTGGSPTFTKTNHGFTTGDIARFNNFVENTQLNGLVGTVDINNPNEFTVNGVSGATAETTGGTAEKIVGGFPDEYEYIVVLYASIRAAQSLLASEEDDDLYIPMVNTLKADYIQAVNLLGGKIEQPKKASSDNANMQNMLNQMLEYGK